MKKDKIVDIKEINENECAITYEVLNKQKDALYRKDSQQLLDRMNRYIDFLYKKDQKLRQKSEDKIFYKQVFSSIFIILITLIVVYFIMSIALTKAYYISLLGYIISLLLIGLSFIVAYGISYKPDLRIENDILQNENEILRAESVRDSCEEVVKSKNKSDKKSK